MAKVGRPRKLGPNRATFQKYSKYAKKSVKSGKKYPLVRSLNDKTMYRYSRYNTAAETLTVTGSYLAYSPTFSLESVRGYTDFTSLYDCYKIYGVQIKVQLITNPNSTWATDSAAAPNNAQQQVSNWYPKLWYVYDNDDNSDMTLATVRERQGAKYKILKPNREVKFFVKPSALVQTYKTALTTGYAPKRLWLDVYSASSVPHYGMKFIVDTLGLDPNDTYPFKILVETKYYLHFKGVL